MPDNSDAVIEPYIVFSDGVIREAGTGKLSLIGTFENWNATAFPFRSRPFVMTVRLTNLAGKLKKTRITFRVEESGSGHVLASVGAEVASAKELSRTDAIELPLKMPAIQYQHPGNYDVVVLVDNEPIGKRILRVTAVTQGASPPDIKEE